MRQVRYCKRNHSSGEATVGVLIVTGIVVGLSLLMNLSPRVVTDSCTVAEDCMDLKCAKKSCDPLTSTCTYTSAGEGCECYESQQRKEHCNIPNMERPGEFMCVVEGQDASASSRWACYVQCSATEATWCSDDRTGVWSCSTGSPAFQVCPENGTCTNGRCQCQEAQLRCMNNVVLQECTAGAWRNKEYCPGGATCQDSTSCRCQIDGQPPRQIHRDKDKDGYYSSFSQTGPCGQPADVMLLGCPLTLSPQKPGDCDDDDPAVHPGGSEGAQNGKDEDCNGVCDDGAVMKVYEKFLCDQSQGTNCGDVLITTNINEGGGWVYAEFYTSRDRINGVTSANPLRRCNSPGAGHKITLDDRCCRPGGIDCNNWQDEGTFGYPFAENNRCTGLQFLEACGTNPYETGYGGAQMMALLTTCSGPVGRIAPSNHIWLEEFWVPWKQSPQDFTLRVVQSNNACWKQW